MGMQEEMTMHPLKTLRSIDIYNWMIAVLALLTASGLYSFYAADFASALPAALSQVVAAVIVGLIIDTAVIRFREKAWRLSRSAIITGFFVGTILAPLPDVRVAILAAVIAILQKHILRLNSRPLFNPAGFGVVAAGLLFGIDHAWWAAALLLTVAILGLFIAVIFGRLHMVAPYLVAYWALSSTAILVSGESLTFLQGRILDSTMLFFTFLMLVEPMTSPFNRKGRIAYSVLAAAFAAAFEQLGVPYFVPMNLLAANLFSRPLEKWSGRKAK